MFSKILIANRGEIACRVMRTARAMGITSVAVYSDADAAHGPALHVREADEAIPIGPRDAESGVEPYIMIDRIVGAAKASGAEAVHPGYGFLSENPDFVEAIEAAGLVFIGPSADAIRAMGLKDAAKKLMDEAGVPVVPGYHGNDQDSERLAQEAEKIGYPILIKARAGGGGKGMRLVEDPKDFASALEGAQREGKASFGDAHVLIEKFVTAPRHIEIQVFGDNHGDAVYLFERDCSLQRRHQKVIEEAPAPGMSDEMRQAMGDAAVRAAKAIGYSGAGTIEFIVDGSEGLRPDRFWFMEMNTRLQVEHPVTEAITGQDLVEWQLRVANGEPLPVKQEDLGINGHAIEARLYAENVPRGFLPATGRIDHLKFSSAARNDTAVTAGDHITPFYDPMIAKIIVHGTDRESAIAQMQQALAETEVAGSVTNLEFLAALMRHEGFCKGDLDTGLIGRDLEKLVAPNRPGWQAAGAAAIAASGELDQPTGDDPFDMLANYVHWHPVHRTVTFQRDEDQMVVRFKPESANAWCVEYAGGTGVLHRSDSDPNEFIAQVDGTMQSIRWFATDAYVSVFSRAGSFVFELVDPLDANLAGSASGDNIVSPMPGLVKKVFCKPGAAVSEGNPMIILEAMKMEHTLTAPRNGKVGVVNVSEGDQVEDGAELASLEPENG